MDWILRGPQINSTFSNLGNVHLDGYHVSENCNSALEEILQNLLAEDKILRNYRRNVHFGHNVERDLMPLLLHAMDDKTRNLIIRILVNLTTPIEKLLQSGEISKTDFGRHTIFEIHKLLVTTKDAFTDGRAMKVVIEFLKKNINVEPKEKLSDEQLDNASNCLLLLRNILQIPEQSGLFHNIYNGSNHSVQNQIIWNLFNQSIDNVIIKAMTISNSKKYGVTIVQLLNSLYKDQDILTINQFLKNWQESYLSDSSEDNESNTEPKNRGCDDSSPISSSDPTSDSSDSSAQDSKEVSATPTVTDGWENSPGDDYSGPLDDNNQPLQTCDQDIIDDDKYTSSQDNSICDNTSAEITKENHIKAECEIAVLAKLNDSVYKNKKRQIISEITACGYGTQIENQEFDSSSSNDDDLPPMKRVYKKTRKAKQWPNNKPRPSTTLQERKRKNIVKRLNSSVINVHSPSHEIPADDDITKVIQEFTVDFMLKGFNSLVKTLHDEIITNRDLESDTSHFFWLVTYFLQFATKMELNLELVDSVLSFDFISYFVAEAVNLCEQFELAIKLDGVDLCPILYQQRMVVKSIREFVQAIQSYKKVQVSDKADYEKVEKLQIKVAETEDFTTLMVLLFRHYNPGYHSKQYLEDLVVTNHALLSFLVNVRKIPEYNGSIKIMDKIRQFATPDIMSKYGLLLEDFNINGEDVNNCIFTMMFHVGGDLGCIDTLTQSRILKTFAAILQSEWRVLEDWKDIMLYAINTVIRKAEPINDYFHENDVKTSDSNIQTVKNISKMTNDIALQTADDTPQERWTENEISTLSWNYLQCSAKPDIIGAINKQLKEDNIIKSRTSVIRELFRQDLITKDFYETQLRDSDKSTTTVPMSKPSRDEEIREDGEQLVLDKEPPGLEWVQKILLEICYAKLLIQKKELQSTMPLDLTTKFENFECFKNKHDDIPVVSPVVYHYLTFLIAETLPELPILLIGGLHFTVWQKPVPLVPWNCQQDNMCKDLKFLQLLHNLGFQMPVDTGRVFIQIPHFWTAELIYTVAGKIRPIDTSRLKFSVFELSKSENSKITEYHASNLIKGVKSSDNLYHQLHKPNFAPMDNFTPRPASTSTSENASAQLNWLQIVKKSQQCKLTLHLKRVTEATTEDIIDKLPLGDGESTSVLKSQGTANTARLAAPLVQPSTSTLLPTTSVVQPTISFTLPSTSVLLPTTSSLQLNTSVMPTRSEMMFTSSVMKRSLSITQETDPDDVEREDSCNSDFETASVASDLMRVSDEEEKYEVIARKDIKSGKRRRVLTKYHDLPTTGDIIDELPFGDGECTSVLKSQDTANTARLAAPLMQPSTSTMLPTTCVVQPTTSSLQLNTSVMPTRSEMMFTSSVMKRSLSITQETDPDDLEREDSCNSYFETASVASDLMFVSDEDEKYEVIACKDIKSGKWRRVLIKNHDLLTTEDIIDELPFGDGESTSVLKSQDTANTARLAAPLMQTSTSTMLPTTCVVQPTTSNLELNTSVMPTRSGMMFTSSDMKRSLSITQETDPDDVEREDSCNSDFETASVASDLMRVSDEEEKYEVIDRKDIKSGKWRRVLIKYHDSPTARD